MQLYGRRQVQFREREFSMSEERTIVFSDGRKGLKGDFPVAVVHTQTINIPGGGQDVSEVVDPIFESRVTRNLYGRIMTLVEATTDPVRLKAVKDVFSKELTAWENDVYASARELAIDGHPATPNNIYTRFNQ